MLLIASASYCPPELAAELGLLPPAFLPLGNRRLFEHQVAQARPHVSSIYLSLPADFQVSALDRAKLAQLGVDVVYVPPGLSIGESVRHCLETLQAAGRFDVLYGDTLIQDIDFQQTNICAVGRSSDNYVWERRSIGGETQSPWVTAGYFSFTSAAALRDAIERNQDDYLAAVRAYDDAGQKVRQKPVSRWLDFGHLTTYYRSRAHVTSERAFNSLSIRDGVVRKSGADPRKLAAEAAWFQGLPFNVRRYTPTFLGETARHGQHSYALEYMHLPTLSDLFVFGRLPAFTWSRIFAACNEFLTACAEQPASLPKFSEKDHYLGKTIRRLEDYARQSGIDLDREWIVNGRKTPSPLRIAEMCYDRIASGRFAPIFSLIHGDFCFSNILYDFRSERIKVIDPRGIDADREVSPHGDLRYDIGKLTHSAVGLYDFIIAGRFELKRGEGSLDLTLPSAEVAAIRAAFDEFPFLGHVPDEWAGASTAMLLFLSMLPLHADVPERQIAFLANALRMFSEMDNGQTLPTTTRTLAVAA